VEIWALEHAQSSFYYLPEGNIQTLGQTIQDVCAHEFFHILNTFKRSFRGNWEFRLYSAPHVAAFMAI
jgi:hypothetical protein